MSGDTSANRDRQVKPVKVDVLRICIYTWRKFDGLAFVRTYLSGPLLRMAYPISLRCVKLKWILLLELAIYLVTCKLMNYL